ncbi:MAG: hypothetical protein NVSMB51_07050 [Solirubrobacteraceae bacterium]
MLAIAGTPATADAPYLDWPGLLPALPTSGDAQPGPQPGCGEPSLACIDYEIDRMGELQTAFGCDHRGVFDTTYLVLTRTLRAALADGAPRFADPQDLESEDALFADYYFRTVAAYDAGKPVPAAWRIAFDNAAAGDATATQDMLLGINAHVQRDMPYVLATLGLHTPGGLSRKQDHDRFNEVLNHAYGAVVRTIAQRYDRFTAISNPGTVADNLAGLELVKAWRENVWRNAERLLNATSPLARGLVEASIENNAALTARMIAAPQVLLANYRTQRDAYCGSRGVPGSAPG